MFTLEEVVPWGRSYGEYRRMFSLTDDEVRLSIVDCGGGPASFNAEATRCGARVVSCDPLYRWASGPIADRIASTRDTILEQTRRNSHEFVWESINSVEELAAMRTAAMTDFLSDYEVGKAKGRYVDAALPRLPFPDRHFDLALCSHFLFLYSLQLSEDFHLAAIREMCRVAAEARIFPLVALGGERSPHVNPVMDVCRRNGLLVSIETVPYKFQRGANQMMSVRRPHACG